MDEESETVTVVSANVDLTAEQEDRLAGLLDYLTDPDDPRRREDRSWTD